MRSYETIFIIDCALEEEATKNLVSRIRNEIESLGGVIKNLDEWGKKKLAYSIDYKSEGYYVFIEFDANPETPLALERLYRITEGILKGLVVKTEK
jgi:small subunit ribosomal protein S6